MRTLAPLLCLLAAAILMADEPTARQLYRSGRAAEKAGKMAQAYIFYSEAAAKDPKTPAYWLRMQTVQSRAALQSGPQSLPVELPAEPDDPALDAEPAPELPAATAADIADSKRLLPPTVLEATGPALRDFDITGDANKLFEELAKTYGLSVIFDADYQMGRPFRFRLDQVSYRDAFHGLEAATNSFIVPITGKMFLVARDTAQKRTELEPTVAVSIRLPEAAATQDFNAMITAVQQALALEKVSFDTQNNTVIIRDRVSKVLPAQALFRDLLYPRAQVVIDLKIMEVSRNDTLTYGVDFPTLFSLSPLTNWFNNPTNVPSNIVGLLKFGGGKTALGLGIMMPELVAQLSNSKGSVLLSSELRSMNLQAASLHVGNRYPIQTAAYTGSSGVLNTGTYGSAPSFSYEDLGLTLKVTPVVHNIEEATIEVDAQYKVLTGQSVNGVPVIANRALKSDVRLRIGEWAMVSGLLNSTDAHTIAGLPGVAKVPYLGALTSTHEHDSDDSHVLILMRPRLITLPANAAVTHIYHVGTETRPLTPL